MSFNGADSELSHPAVVRERNWRLNVGGTVVPYWFCLLSLSSPPVTKAVFFCTCALNVTQLGLLCLSDSQCVHCFFVTQTFQGI